MKLGFSDSMVRMVRKMSVDNCERLKEGSTVCIQQTDRDQRRRIAEFLSRPALPATLSTLSTGGCTRPLMFTGI